MSLKKLCLFGEGRKVLFRQGTKFLSNELICLYDHFINVKIKTDTDAAAKPKLPHMVINFPFVKYIFLLKKILQYPEL